MANDPMYHDGMRRLQDARETRPLADRLETVHSSRAVRCSSWQRRMPTAIRTVPTRADCPRPGYSPPVPAWKTFDSFRDALPARDRPDAKKE